MSVSYVRSHVGRGRLLAIGLALASVASLASPASPLAASTFVPVPDGALADQAALIAEVTVESERPYVPPAPLRAAANVIATDYRVHVDRVIKGTAAAERVTVRVPGGTRANGLSATLWGAPRFTVGENLLLFLEARPDGSYRVLHLFLGAFHLAATRNVRVALRSFAGATELRIGSRRAGTASGSEAGSSDLDRPRHYDRFVAWLAARAAGETPAADYFVDLAPGDLSALREKFTLFFVSGANERWFEFDSGGTVPFYAGQGGQPSLDGGGFAEFQAALQAWNDNPGTFIHLAYAGTTATQGALASYNGINEISFDDPFDELTPFDCANGGFLAYTQTFWDSSLRSWKGVEYAQMVGAHVITNKNIACTFADDVTPSNLAQSLFTHELGHAVGLGHSCGDGNSPSCANPVLDDASMRSIIHFDGRGTRLAADDQAAVRLLYSNVAVPPVKCKADAQTLCMDQGRFAVTANWINQYNNTSGSAGAILGTDEAGYFYFSAPSNVELMVKVLQLGNVFKVFYGELTDLDFTLSVSDTHHHTAHSYHNTPGNCGGIDDNAFAAAGAGPKRGGGCLPSGGTLCLLNGRFAIKVSWSNPGNGTSGTASGKQFSNEVGTFFFTDPANVELMTKLIEFPDRIAFFWGALSNLPYSIAVTDTESGTRKVYQSTAGKLCGGLDNQAF
jgi:hypothetical protein